MIPLHDWLLFAGAALLMVLTPGPNMVYLVSRTLCQGRRAGTVSLLGVIAGFVVHLLATGAGLTAMLMAVPLAYDVLRWCGAAYLLFLAWQSLGASGRSPFQARALPREGARRLFLMGFVTNLLNPKIAVFYLSIFPQFIAPEHGSVFAQCLLLGATQIVISFAVNLSIVCTASSISGFFGRHPRWLSLQRHLMGLVLGGLALRLALDTRR